MAKGIRTDDPRGFNKERSSKFREGSRVRQIPEEGQRTYRPKRCRNNNKDEDNSTKTLNVMHRKRVTYELHYSYFRSTMIKHATPKRAEVACSVGQLWEEIAETRRRVHISAWEFDGNIRPMVWTEDSEIPQFTQACPVVTPCAFSRPSSTYTKGSRPHRRTILIPLLIAPTSHKRSSRK